MEKYYKYKMFSSKHVVLYTAQEIFIIFLFDIKLNSIKYLDLMLWYDEQGPLLRNGKIS